MQVCAACQKDSVHRGARFHHGHLPSRQVGHNNLHLILQNLFQYTWYLCFPHHWSQRLLRRVIVFEGSPSVETTANSPQSLLSGMNKFLEQLKVTFRWEFFYQLSELLSHCLSFRRDPNNYRPRINKANSIKDCEQKLSGKHQIIISFLQFLTLVLPLITLAFPGNFFFLEDWGRPRTPRSGATKHFPLG